jgi:hypothetical protein
VPTLTQSGAAPGEPLCRGEGVQRDAEGTQFTCFTGAKVQMLTRLRRQHLEHYIERMPLRTEDRKIQDWKGEMDKVSALLLALLALLALIALLALLVQMYQC